MHSPCFRSNWYGTDTNFTVYKEDYIKKGWSTVDNSNNIKSAFHFKWNYVDEYEEWADLITLAFLFFLSFLSFSSLSLSLSLSLSIYLSIYLSLFLSLSLSLSLCSVYCSDTLNRMFSRWFIMARLYVDTVKAEVNLLDKSRPFLLSSPSNGIVNPDEGWWDRNGFLLALLPFSLLQFWQLIIVVHFKCWRDLNHNWQLFNMILLL